MPVPVPGSLLQRTYPAVAASINYVTGMKNDVECSVIQSTAVSSGVRVNGLKKPE